MRFNELISGVRSDVAVKVFGDDMATLLKIAEKIDAQLEKTPGSADVKVEQVSGLPLLTVENQSRCVSALWFANWYRSRCQCYCNRR